MSRSVAKGSSPLARGLQDAMDEGGYRARIIPARAGFTDREPAGILLARDHPRSRGVYGAGVTGNGSVLGSSPLARGLLVWEAGTPVLTGIIPARAGFTVGRGVPEVLRRDHPRSRGVYLR